MLLVQVVQLKSIENYVLTTFRSASFFVGGLMVHGHTLQTTVQNPGVKFAASRNQS